MDGSTISIKRLLLLSRQLHSHTIYMITIITIGIFNIIYLLYKKDPDDSTLKKIVHSKVENVEYITSNISIY